jgi:hypothetical protein
MKPPDEFELLLPRLGLPLVKGVDDPGGDSEILGCGLGDVVLGDRESGGTYRWDGGFGENGRGVAAADFVGCVAVTWELDDSEAFVFMVLGLEVTVAAVMETCAEETKELGDMPELAPLDFAWNVGLERARKAEKRFAKNGRFVGMLSCL